MALITDKDFEADEEMKAMARKTIDDGVHHPFMITMLEVYGDSWATHWEFPNKCFCCGKKISVPFIFWAGHIDMAFHPKCAEHLIKGLDRDVNEFIKLKQE